MPRGAGNFERMGGDFLFFFADLIASVRMCVYVARTIDLLALF